MNILKFASLVGFSFSLIQTSHGALSQGCADKLYDKFHREGYEVFIKGYKNQYTCFPGSYLTDEEKDSLPTVPNNPAHYYAGGNEPYKDLVNSKPAQKDHLRFYSMLRYPDFTPSTPRWNEETKGWNQPIARVTGFSKKAYDCAMESARKTNDDLKKFYLSIAQEANTNCGASEPRVAASQVMKEFDVLWYNVINSRYMNDGQAQIYPFSIDPKFESSFSGNSKLSFVNRFVDENGKITPKERYTVEIPCKDNNNMHQTAWRDTLWGRPCSEIENIINYASKTEEKIYPDNKTGGASIVYYKGIKTLETASRPQVEKKEAKPSTDVSLVKTGEKTAEIRAYGNLYYDDSGNLVKGKPTHVSPVQCDGTGMPSCSDVLKDFEKTYAKTPSYIVDKATALNELYAPPASSQAASGANTSSATGTTPVAAAPVKTELPSKAPEVELIDNGDGTAKLMFFNDFYYNEKGELVRSEASQITTVQCGKNKSVTCEQTLADAKRAMSGQTGYLVSTPGASSVSSGVASSASDLSGILAQAASKAQTSLTCGQNDLVAMGTSLQVEIEAIKKKAIEEIEKVNAKYKKMALDKGCNIPETSTSSSQSVPKTKESDSLERVMGAF